MSQEFLDALDLGGVTQGGFQDGRVVDLRRVGDQPVYLVGDVHARVDVIPLILSQAELEPQLEAESAVLVFLGDLHHREDDEGAGEMMSSVETFRRVMDLKTRYPRNVYVLLGNHEFTHSGSTKRGYFQGDLFRKMLELEDLYEVYREFLSRSPLVVIHPRFVGVHAGPAKCLDSLESLKRVEVRDVPAMQMEQAVRELCFSRHVDWSPNPDKHYYDHHVRDFLHLCGVPEARLITGHTPLQRDTDWRWDIGRHLTVIFAAGREVGYFRATDQEERFVRVARRVGDEFRLDRTRRAQLSTGDVQINERGVSRVQTTIGGQQTALCADVEYVWSYPSRSVKLMFCGEQFLNVAHFRDLDAGLQSYYAMGYYLVGNGYRGEVLQLRTDLAVLIGGESLREGVRFSWGDEEKAVLCWLGEDRFSLRPLVEGLSLSE